MMMMMIVLGSEDGGDEGKDRGDDSVGGEKEIKNGGEDFDFNDWANDNNNDGYYSNYAYIWQLIYR